MLNEMIGIFVGMLNYCITEICGMSISEFENYDFFVGCLCIVVTVLVLAGAFSLLCVVVSATFGFVWRSSK